jgi:light-regulated signal transduction histidine kinase (bacteriophytochrome)
MISKIQRGHKTLPSTEMERIDTILNYMSLKASEKDIQFDVVITGKIKSTAESVISKQQLETLLADLIENAIIAVSHSDCDSNGNNSAFRKILVTMGIAEGCYEINVQDSGIPFEAETLGDLGLKRMTTHGDRGGSGIGYMAIFKILGENSASLIISEQVPENHTFSKSIKVRFDDKSEFVIYSYRTEDIKSSSERKEMSIFGDHAKILASGEKPDTTVAES